MTDIVLTHAIAQIESSRSSGRLPIVRTFFDEATFTASHVVHDPATNKAAIIDSVLDFDQASGRTSHGSADAIIAYVRDAGLHVEWQIETHAHADHLSAAPYLIDALGGTLVIGREITTVQRVFGDIFHEDARFARDGSQFDQLVSDGDQFTLGDIAITVLHTPGHTPACMSWLIGDALFVGDTLFMPDYGTARADFPGGNARILFRSIRRLLALPAQTRVFLCHDYKAPNRDVFAWESSIGAQREHNVHIHDGVDEDAFVAMRQTRDATLGMPRLILPSIQINMRGGNFPEPEANGTRYLKLPLNTL